MLVHAEGEMLYNLSGIFILKTLKIIPFLVYYSNCFLIFVPVKV